MERKQKREGVDMTYLKNVILKLLETGKIKSVEICSHIHIELRNITCMGLAAGEVEALLPVVGMLLQFSPEEVTCFYLFSFFS